MLGAIKGLIWGYAPVFNVLLVVGIAVLVGFGAGVAIDIYKPEFWARVRQRVEEEKREADRT
jgi:hypothetical protein